ncbi:MAG: glycoside hydrolase family 73 protein [Prevotella sp.]
MGKNAAYAAQYAEEAKEQMRRYGIPASVILAQAILESSNGQSQLSRECNNHFGIKATASWLKNGWSSERRDQDSLGLSRVVTDEGEANGGEYGVYTDDKPNEKFCKYKSVGDSYEHHSQFLKQNKRYAQCFTLSPDDYKGWTKGIERAGYATDGSYAASLQRIIEANGLDRYDREVMAEIRAEGRSFGVENNPRREASSDKTAVNGRSNVTFSGNGKIDQPSPPSSDEWMKKMLASDDSGVGISGTNDPILDMAVTMFVSLMMLATQFDSKEEARQQEHLEAMAARKTVNLVTLVPGMRQCTLSLRDNGTAVLLADNGSVKIHRALTSAEMGRLSVALSNENLSDEAKRTRVAGLVTGIVAAQQASQNFERGMEAEHLQYYNQRR